MRARLRSYARIVRIETSRLLQLRSLPPRVAWFHLRARARARRDGDQFSLVSALHPDEAARLLALAGDRTTVAELGTATAWTAIALALQRPGRHVVSFDPVRRPECDRYLSLVSPRVRAAVELVTAPGASGPRPVQLLYIDSSHEREPTLEEVRAWAPQLAPGSLIVFDDYRHPDYPGVAAAIAELGLDGEVDGPFFVHRVPGDGVAAPAGGSGDAR